ncbi:MAG: hypothetical protein HQK53_14880 [Oligoflexia bacterium]|nr:hypothetical protein [Oligoflexia bacterium]
MKKKIIKLLAMTTLTFFGDISIYAADQGADLSCYRRVRARYLDLNRSAQFQKGGAIATTVGLPLTMMAVLDFGEAVNLGNPTDILLTEVSAGIGIPSLIAGGSALCYGQTRIDSQNLDQELDKVTLCKQIIIAATDIDDYVHNYASKKSISKKRQNHIEYQEIFHDFAWRLFTNLHGEHLPAGVYWDTFAAFVQRLKILIREKNVAGTLCADGHNYRYDCADYLEHSPQHHADLLRIAEVEPQTINIRDINGNEVPVIIQMLNPPTNLMGPVALSAHLTHGLTIALEDEHYDQCPICLESFVNHDDSVTLTGCAHLYHTKCYLHRHNPTCPICGGDFMGENANTTFNIIEIRR